ncbi:MAG TPA: TetR family transcriptional regulator [Pseudonocardiaceae bacterium]
MTAASTPKGERRRQELVAAAAALLAEGGFDAVRHRAVAERAGLPLASTTYYFRSLDELVMAAVEHGARAELDELRQELAEAAEGAFVELFLDALLGRRRDPADFDAVLVRYERFVAAARRPWLGPLMRELRAELDTLLADMARRFGRSADREELNRLVAVVDGAVISALIESDPDPRAAARRMLLPLL